MTIKKAVKAPKPLDAKCTPEEREVLRKHGFPWFPGYWPTIRIEHRGDADYTPSCATVADARLLRSAVVKMGIGYFDGSKTIGRKVLHLDLLPGAQSTLAIGGQP